MGHLSIERDNASRFRRPLVSRVDNQVPLALGNFIQYLIGRCSLKFLWANGQCSLEICQKK